MRLFLPILLLLLSSAEAPLRAEDILDDLQLRECLVIPPVGQGGRMAVHTDALEAQIIRGTWQPPKAGETLTLKFAKGVVRTWSRVQAVKGGWLRHQALRGGYACATLSSDEERVVLLEALGHSMLYVNGEARTGDPYFTGWLRLPVLLRRGKNVFLFRCARGQFKARLLVPRATAQLDLKDTTLPDLIQGQALESEGGVVVLNTSQETLRGLSLWAAAPAGQPRITRLPPLPPLSARKVGFQLGAASQEKVGPLEFELRLLKDQDQSIRVLDRQQLKLHVRAPLASHKRTFRSEIDGSVQYFAINPAKAPAAGSRPALVLSLHGAAVIALNQAKAYGKGKTWAHIVAPTNRRPFGFDWEDWGRLDALEVLEHVQSEFKTDPRRVYLTGHSMGGHGTWHVGVTFPDRFAALGPSAGWISFFSYAGLKQAADGSPVGALLARSSSSSDTLALKGNYSQQGIYILHGDADDNVPVGQARKMRKVLGEFHKDLQYHEEPGKKHWWDNSPEPGSSCVDWAPMFDLFARRTLPLKGSLRKVEFTTASPGVSSACHWVEIWNQGRQHQPSSVKAHCDPGRRHFKLSTENVTRLAIDLENLPAGEPFKLEVNGQEALQADWPQGEARVWLELGQKGSWALGEPPSLERKGPHRYGPFKDAFRNRVLFVYGTQGSPEENAWAYAKARYDAETFWYRGNGSVDLVKDVDFAPEAQPERSVVLYGHSESNSAWATLLGESPVQVRRGGIRFGERVFESESLACLFIRPRPGSDRALVGAVSGSGILGLRLSDRLPYFISGAGFPDLLILGPEALENGLAGIRQLGFFGDDWSIQSGEFAGRRDP